MPLESKINGLIGRRQAESLHILLVEDNLVDARFITGLLKGAGGFERSQPLDGVVLPIRLHDRHVFIADLDYSNGLSDLYTMDTNGTHMTKIVSDQPGVFFSDWGTST